MLFLGQEPQKMKNLIMDFFCSLPSCISNNLTQLILSLSSSTHDLH